MHDFDAFVKLVCEDNEVHEETGCCSGCCDSMNYSELYNWPIKLTQIPVDDHHFDDCDLLLAADCTAFAYAQLHERFIKDKVALIFCPHDAMSLHARLKDILSLHTIKTMMLVIMDKECCESAVPFVAKSLKESKRAIPFEIIRINKDGEIVQ